MGWCHIGTVVQWDGVILALGALVVKGCYGRTMALDWLMHILGFISLCLHSVSMWLYWRKTFTLCVEM